MTKLNRAGLTLLELMITISIIALLSAMLYIGTTSYLKNARDARRRSDLAQIATAIDQYILDHKSAPPEFPDSDQFGCDTSVGRFKISPSDGSDCYLWGHIIYTSPIKNRWENVSDPTNNYWTLAAAVEGNYISKLPVDPINDRKYFYLFEPDSSGQSSNGPACTYNGCRYILEARMEADNSFFQIVR